MRDEKVSLPRIKLLHPKIASEIEALVNAAEKEISPNISIRIVQGLRTIKEQDDLYAIGRTKAGKKVTQAKGGQSYHNYGLAIDFAFLTNEGKELSWDTKKDWDNDLVPDWIEVVRVFMKAGYEWGGSWKFTDLPHFQKIFGLDWRDMLAKVNKKDFITGTQFINL